MTSLPQPDGKRHPYRPGGQYRPSFSFRSARDSFTVGEVLTFVDESRDDAQGLTRYVFADATGTREFDVRDDMPSMALYRRFRAVEARDGGCPECREQRFRGLGPPLHQLGHGAGLTMYYRCHSCLALWEETTREAHIVWDVLLSCEHLQPLERALRESGVAVELEDKDWEHQHAGFRVYFRARIDRATTLAQFPMAESVEWRERDGRSAGQEAGFECTGCNSAVMGVHPVAAAGFPVFPTPMKVPPLPLGQTPTAAGEHPRQGSLVRGLMPVIVVLSCLLVAVAIGWWAGKSR